MGLNPLAVLLVISTITSYAHSSIYQHGMINTLFQWRLIDYAYPTPEERTAAINEGKFIPSNVIPLGVERWKNRIFVSTPPWKKGIPASLSSLRIARDSPSPPLQPYPDWDWHNAVNCTGLTSVFRMNVDHCGVMWIIDSGQVEGFETPRQICPPKLVAIDLEKDAVIGIHTLPDNLVLQNSLITNLIVDSRDEQCQDLHVYIADARRFNLIVFRNSDAKFWSFSHYTFYPEPLLSNYTLHGVNFQWTDGLFGMSLGKVYGGDRPLYYHAMSGSHEFVVKTSVIRNPARVSDSVDEFILLGQSRGARGQVSASAVDSNGVMFFNLVSLDSVGCWNTHLPYDHTNIGIIAHDPEKLVFPNDLRLDHGTPPLIWIISNKLPMYQFNLLNPRDYNFRILYIDTQVAMQVPECYP